MNSWEDIRGGEVLGGFSETDLKILTQLCIRLIRQKYLLIVLHVLHHAPAGGSSNCGSYVVTAPSSHGSHYESSEAVITEARSNRK
jgi:hypothetical protein